eukprot:9151748-Ditylum_brightwellii.AAC.1
MENNSEDNKDGEPSHSSTDDPTNEEDVEFHYLLADSPQDKNTIFTLNSAGYTAKNIKLYFRMAVVFI